MKTPGTKHIAYHEAGHVVAHFRLDVYQGIATIKPSGDNAGHVTSEGIDHVWNAIDARTQVLSYCASFAALIAAGHSEDDAKLGADDDFEKAAELIKYLQLTMNDRSDSTLTSK